MQHSVSATNIKRFRLDDIKKRTMDWIDEPESKPYSKLPVLWRREFFTLPLDSDNISSSVFPADCVSALWQDKA